MMQNENIKESPKHFLFYIFQMDQKENPMPEERAEALLQRVRCIFINEKRRCGYGTGNAY